MTRPPAATTLDDILRAIRHLTDVTPAASEVVVGTPEAFCRLKIGWETLDRLVRAGRIRRIANLRGRGNSHC